MAPSGFSPCFLQLLGGPRGGPRIGSPKWSKRAWQFLCLVPPQISWVSLFFPFNHPKTGTFKKRHTQKKPPVLEEYSGMHHTVGLLVSSTALKEWGINLTVDGQSPAPLGGCFIPLFRGFHLSQVVQSLLSTHSMCSALVLACPVDSPLNWSSSKRVGSSTERLSGRNPHWPS